LAELTKSHCGSNGGAGGVGTVIRTKKGRIAGRPTGGPGLARIHGLKGMKPQIVKAQHKKREDGRGTGKKVKKT